jgi:phage FluMu protein Com
MALPEKYAGQHVQCPDCHAMLLIPTREEDLSLTRWSCSCGQRLKARSRTAGRKVRCPKCSSKVLVPFSNAPPAPVQESFTLDDASGIVYRVPEAGEAGRMPPKSKIGDAYEVEAEPAVEPDHAPQQPVRASQPTAKTPKLPKAAQASEEEAYAEEVEEEDEESGGAAPGTSLLPG